MVDTIQIGEKGTGITTAEQFDIFKYADEGLRHHKGDNSKIVKYVTQHMNHVHHGKWTVFLIASSTVPWEIEFFPVDNKHIQFSLYGFELFVFKSSD